MILHFSSAESDFFSCKERKEVKLYSFSLFYTLWPFHFYLNQFFAFIYSTEAIVGSRKMSQKKEKTSNESILSMLLTEMDGIGTMSQCATDRESQVCIDYRIHFKRQLMISYM